MSSGLELWRMAFISSCSPTTAEYGSLRSRKKLFPTVISRGSATQMPGSQREMCKHVNDSRISRTADEQSSYRELVTDWCQWFPSLWLNLVKRQFWLLTSFDWNKNEVLVEHWELNCIHTVYFHALTSGGLVSDMLAEPNLPKTNFPGKGCATQYPQCPSTHCQHHLLMHKKGYF